MFPLRWRSRVASAVVLSAAFGFGAVDLHASAVEPTFERVDITVGAAPLNPSIADANGDGRPDILMATAGGLAVIYGNGAGAFSRVSLLDVGIGPNSVTVGDLNGDRLPDLAVADELGDTVSVLLADRAGGFRPKTSYPSAEAPATVRIADVNRDGIPDLIDTAFDASTVGVFLGKGGGAFAPEATMPLGSAPHHELADVDRDGLIDVVTADFEGDSVTVALGTGRGTFVRSAAYPVGMGPNDIDLGDVNGDGALDAVTADTVSGSVTVLLGSTDGSFAAGGSWPVASYPNNVAIADLDGDGAKDVAASSGYGMSSVSILLGNGRGGFERAPDVSVGPSPWGLDAGDVNGDGQQDLVVGNQGGDTVSLLVNKTRRSVSYGRIAGADRVATSVDISQRAFLGGAPAVVIATAFDYPDALAAAPLARAYGGPVLLTPAAELPGSVVDELERLAPSQVFIVGSAAAVSDHVGTQLASLPSRPTVTRLGGADRFETCAKIADQLKEKLGSITKVVAVTGYNYADALSAAPLAAAEGWPILLVRRTSVPSAIAGALGRLAPSSTLVMGGANVVSDGVKGAFPNAYRAYGADRYETCARTLDYARTQGIVVSHVALAVGTNFPDALSAGPYLAQDSGLLLLTATNTLPAPISQRLRENKSTITILDAIGSANVVSDAVVGQAKRQLN